MICEVELVGDPRLVLRADVAVVDRVEMGRVAHQVAGGEDRVFRDQHGDVLRRGHADLEVAALHRLDLGALGEERAVVVDLHVEGARHQLVELFLEDDEALRLDLVLRARGGDADHLGLGQRRAGRRRPPPSSRAAARKLRRRSPRVPNVMLCLPGDMAQVRPASAWRPARAQASDDDRRSKRPQASSAMLTIGNPAGRWPACPIEPPSGLPRYPLPRGRRSRRRSTATTAPTWPPGRPRPRDARRGLRRHRALRHHRRGRGVLRRGPDRHAGGGPRRRDPARARDRLGGRARHARRRSARRPRHRCGDGRRAAHAARHLSRAASPRTRRSATSTR